MDFDELNDFADWESRRLADYYKKTNEEMVFPTAIKLSEEVGELMDEVLKHSGIQRKEKMESKDVAIGKIAEEFADVVLVATLLAKRLGVDVAHAIEAKIDKVRARRYD